MFTENSNSGSSSGGSDGGGGGGDAPELEVNPPGKIIYLIKFKFELFIK